MRGLTRRWTGPSKDDPLRDAGLPLHERIARARGLGSCGTSERADRAERVLRNPDDATLLHDAATLPGADAVARALVDAVRARRSIAIYGDYDADGITSLAVLWHVLRAAAPDLALELYAPSRFETGYGLHADVLRQMHARGVKTVVSVDCGITAVQPAHVARQLGLQLLITDHHLPDADAQGNIVLPDADAIAHPALPHASAPFPHVCGAAVAHKVATQFARHWCGGERVAQVLQDALVRTLPLVALGTVADVVPLLDENRVLAATGLRALQLQLAADQAIPGIVALLQDAKLANGARINSEDIAFKLAPRLNAAGRLGNAAEAVELLTTADAARARTIAANLGRRNEERRTIEAAIFQQACTMLEAKGMHQSERRAIVLAHADWHEGVIGVVCSKLVDRYSRPTVLLCTRPDGSAKGSGRAPDGFDLAAAMRGCGHHLDACGGHAAAAGLTVKPNAADQFAEEFIQHCNGSVNADALVSEIKFDTHASLAEMTERTLKGLDVLRPFGRSNREPLVCLSGLVAHTPPATFGSTRTHLEVHVKGQGPAVRAVWWSGARHLLTIGRARSFDAIVSPKIDSWNGRTRVQLDIQDVAIAGT